MNIFFDGRAMTKTNTSGIPEYAKLLFKNLIETRRSDERYSLFFNSFFARELPDELKGLPFETVDWRIPNKAISALSGVFGFPRIGRRFDVLFRPHFHPLRAGKGVRDILVVHDLSFARFPEFFSPKKRAWHFLQGVRKQILRADGIVAISEATKRDIIEFSGIDDGKISVVHSGLNDFFRQPVSAAETEEYKRRNAIGGRYALFVGTLEPRKNIDGIIRAFSIMKQEADFSDVSLIIVGAKGWLYDKIFKEAASSPYAEDIRFFGHVPFEDLRYLYRGASVFVFPSFFEGFGFPPLEAQACGVPVVSSSRSGLREVLGESALTVDPRDDNAIAEAMRIMIADEPARKRVREEGKKNSNRFHWKEAAERIRNVIRGIVSQEEK